MGRRASSSGMAVGDHRTGPPSSGRANRPEWVSCRPMTRSSVRPWCSTCASTSCGAVRRGLGVLVRRDRKLARVRAPVVADRDGLAAPDELRPGLRRSVPSAGGPGRWEGRRPCRPTPPWAAPRTGCRPSDLRRDRVAQPTVRPAPVSPGRRSGGLPRARSGGPGTDRGSSVSGPGGSTASRLHRQRSSRWSSVARISRSLSGRRGAPGGGGRVGSQPRRCRNCAAECLYAGTGPRNANVPSAWRWSLRSRNEESPRGPARRPAPRTIRGERAEPEQVVAAVHDHVDGEVVAGEHVEVGPFRVPPSEPLPFQVATQRRVLCSDAGSDGHHGGVGVEVPDPSAGVEHLTQLERDEPVATITDQAERIDQLIWLERCETVRREDHGNRSAGRDRLDCRDSVVGRPGIARSIVDIGAGQQRSSAKGRRACLARALRHFIASSTRSCRCRGDSNAP